MSRLQRTFTIHWRREAEPLVQLRCSGLNMRVASARLIRAIRNSGPVIIDSVERDERRSVNE